MIDHCLTCEATLTRINSFLEDALQFSCEGIMVKSLDIDAGYLPSKRGDTWLKVLNLMEFLVNCFESWKIKNIESNCLVFSLR